MIRLSNLARTAACGLALAICTAGSTFADGHSETQHIIDVLESYETYVNESNAESLGGLYAEDAILLPDRFDVFEGKADITQFYAFAFSALSLELEFTIDPDDIIVADETAYATTSSTGTRYIKEADMTVPEINRELWVFEKIDGDWKIVRYCFNKSE